MTLEVGLNIRHHNGAPWSELLDGVRLAEQAGFNAVMFPDHYLPNEHVPAAGGTRTTAELGRVTAPSDAWILMASLITHTTSIRFGTMMSSSTFRLPGPLAIAAAQLNALSNGRVEVGLGASWLEREHVAFGIPFPGTGERYRRLEEQLRVIRLLWETPPGERFDHPGPTYPLRDAGGIPRPEGIPVPRIVVGGTGLVRTPKVAAMWADEVNTLARHPDDCSEFFAACAAACDSIGRQFSSLRRSVLMSVVCGSDELDINRQLELAGLSREQVAGSFICRPDHLVERLELFRSSGVDRAVLSRRGAVDLPGIGLIGEKVLPALN